MKNKIKSLLNKLPYIKGLYLENKSLKKNTCYVPGHYYSTVISIDEIKGREEEIWKGVKTDGINGIDLRLCQISINFITKSLLRIIKQKKLDIILKMDCILIQMQ